MIFCLGNCFMKRIVMFNKLTETFAKFFKLFLTKEDQKKLFRVVYSYKNNDNLGLSSVKYKLKGKLTNQCINDIETDIQLNKGYNTVVVVSLIEIDE